MIPVPRSRIIVYALLVLGLTAADLGSKEWVFRELGYEYHASDWNWSTPLLWGRFSLTFRTSFNRGALFGLGQGYAWLFALLSVAAVSGIIYWLFVRGEARSLWSTILLALISSGALGNLYDRLGLHGCVDQAGERIYAVRDFIDCTIPGLRYRAPASIELLPEYAWPIFNVADMLLVVGTLSLVVTGMLPPPREPGSPVPPRGPLPAGEGHSVTAVGEPGSVQP